MNSEDVRNILLASAKGAAALGQLAHGTTIGAAALAASALITGIAALLKTRTPEDVRQLIAELNANPAARVDLSGLDEEIAEIIRTRREADATR